MFLSRIYEKLFGGKKRISRISIEARENKPTKLSKAELTELFDKCAPLNRAIVTRAALVSNLIRLEGNQEEINRILYSISPSYGMARIRQIIFNASIQADIYGAGFVEVHLDNNMRPSLSIIHSGSVDFQRDNMGRIVYEGSKIKGLIQQIEAYKEVFIPFENVSMLRYNEKGDEPYGTSLVQNLSEQAQGYLNALNGFAASINKLGFPIYDFSVGDDNHEPTPEVIEDLQQRIKDFGKTTREFVHEQYIKPSVTESKYMSHSVDFDRPFIRAIAIGTGIPESLLTGDARSLSLAAAKVLEELLPVVLIPSMKNSIEVFVEDMFQKLSGKEVNINVNFEPMFSMDTQTKEQNLKTAAERAKILSEIPNLCSVDELRKIAGIETENKVE